MSSRRFRGVRRRALALIVVPLVVLAAVGCSEDAGGSDGGDAAASSTTTSTEATATTSTVPATASTVPVDQTPPVGANGVKVAGDGTLWIASLGSDVLLQVDPSSGRILGRVPTPAGSGPDDVVIAPDGTMFWTGFLSGDVGRVEAGSATTTVLANVGPGANPIARRADGTLVVGRAGAATGLFSVEPLGGAAPVALADPGNLNSFDISPDGSLYAPSLDTASVVEVDPVSGATRRTVAAIDGVPIALRWHEDQLYVLVLSGTTRVVRVDPSSGTVEPFGDTGLAVADNLAVGEDGRVFVTGLGEPTVTVLGPDGTLETTLRIGG
jgi:streptogramin lyase